MKRLFVAGEGACELGRWGEAPEYRAESKRTDGVLAALYWRAGREGVVVEGKRWKDVRKYRAGGHATAEQRTLRALALEAREAGADVLLWVRDTDHDEDRGKQLRTAHEELRDQHADELEIVGWPAVPAIEAWILAIAGDINAPEELSVPRLKQLAEERSLAGERQMVDLIAEREIRTSRSPSLMNWLAQLAQAPTASRS
jgi:hypothetical protein